jgi:PAS domain S-box-containing protein
MKAPTFRDDELAETLGLAKDLLATIANRWHSRLQAGRLGPHTQDEALRVMRSIEAAIACLGDAPASPSAETTRTVCGDDERFRQLVDNIRDYAIFMLTADGHIASWNAGAERIEGYRPEEIIGRPFTLFYCAEDIAGGKPQRDLESAVRDGRYIEEGWRVRNTGERFWAHVTLTALRNSEGRLTGFAMVTRDVTDLREATESLRLSEERMRLMVEAVRDYAIFMLDPGGNVASWNEGAERLKGYRVDEILGKHFSIFYPEEERKRDHPGDELRRAKAEGRYEEEGWRIRKDGSRFWANVVITSVVDREGRHLGFTKVTRDFTEANRLREAQVAIELRDEFLAVAGHELRTPLTGLLMQVQNLARTVNPEDVRLKQRLDKAARAGTRLATLISQMLDVSRITAGRLALDPEPLRLDNVVREVVDRFTEMAQDSHSSIDLRVGPVQGRWDRLRIEQVLTNLVANAIKYGRGQPIVVELRSERGEAVVRVTDGGVGIAPADHKRIFERFERAGGTREFGGFGLGLWISRQIVEASGGWIGVESELGEGSTFTVRLPLEPREHDAAEPT